ncbi:MAG: peptidoglycan DD-metalloendopeptidase family protein [Polyangiaceae bacterium]|nr:peptidoglycan DD-metalloendopeptidase family protein [Polyangiaceae bacterium]
MEHRLTILAGLFFAGGCIGGASSDGEGGGGLGGDAGSGGDATSTVTSTGAGAAGGSGGEGDGGAPDDDCPRARVIAPDGEPLNVRADPSTQNPPIGSLTEGTIVDVLDQVHGESVEGNDVWFSITTAGGLSGYISSVFAVCTSEMPPEPPDGYYAPLHCGVSATITQGNNGTESHNGPTSQYAFDFAVGLNTELVAMAEGTVAFIYDQTGPGDPCYNGGGSECGPYANYVVLRHADNSMTAYKHLNTVLVQVGDIVAQGDVIGLSGSTGWSTGRHVHVVREEDCGAASCTSIPLSFLDFPANGGVPVTGDVVTSGNCPEP